MASRILLVNMPWAPVNAPSLAFGILADCLRRRAPGTDVQVVHANLDFVDWVTEHQDFDGQRYRYYSRTTSVHGCGDWVFSSALYDDPEWRITEFTEYFGGSIPAREMDASIELHRIVPEFVEQLAHDIAAMKPDFVGLQFSTAALAVARKIKMFDADIAIVMGGGACEGAQGIAVHRCFPFVDFVVRGEGELAFPDLVARSAGGAALDRIAGLCWTRDGHQVVNPERARPLPVTDIGEPDFTGFFERLATSRASAWQRPVLFAEGSRGCWWGARHHCTFCGLNGATIDFRCKPAEAFFNVLVSQVERHRILDISIVDRILARDHLNALVPQIQKSGYNLRLQYAIRPDLSGAQVQAMADAGMVDLQVGIENLSTRVLRMMNKRVTGCQNVRVLRDAETSGAAMHWNHLHGFPEETDDDYRPILSQIAALHHLSPPDSDGPIVIERFSPYFDQPGLGFSRLVPARQYKMIYDLPESDLAELALYFGVSAKGISGHMSSALHQALREWRTEYGTSSFTFHDLDDEVVLVSRRRHVPWELRTLTDPVEVEVFRALERPSSVRGLVRRLPIAAVDATALLRRWQDMAIVFHEGDQFVRLPTGAMNQELFKLGVRDMSHAVG